MNIVIKNTRPTQITLNADIKDIGLVTVKLLPGQTDVDDSLWENLKQNPAVKIWLACKYLVESQNQTKAKPLLEETSQVELQDMLKSIEKCDKPELLERWGKIDKRNAVHKAITHRLHVLQRQTEDPHEKVENVEPMVQVASDIQKEPEDKPKVSARRNKQ